MKNAILIILLFLTTSSVADDFNYNLDFRGFDVTKLTTLGCKCETQEQFDFFYESYTRAVALKLHNDHQMSAGILKKNTWSAKGFLGTYNNLLLSDWINTIPTKTYDSMAIFVNWPQFGD